MCARVAGERSALSPWSVVWFFWCAPRIKDGVDLRECVRDDLPHPQQATLVAIARLEQNPDYHGVCPSYAAVLSDLRAHHL